MKDEILKIIATECDLEDIPAFSASLSDLGVDSLAAICAVSALEDRFDISIPLEANEADIETVGEMVMVVEKLIVEKNQR